MNVCKFLNYKFAHHHVHSEFSPLDAPVSLKKLIEYSKHLGYKTVTITDHGTVSAWVKLQTLCKENGLKPIFGIEGYFTPDRKLHTGGRNSYHCVLLAKNSEGVRNIYRLSELAYREGFYYDPRFDWELLEQYHEGVICTSSCVSGLVPDTLRSPVDVTYEGPEGKVLMSPYEAAKKYALRFKSIFGGDFYAEVQYHGIDIEQTPYAGMSRLAKELDLKIVGTNDVHYLRKEDANTQEIMMAINMQKCIKDPQRLRHDTNQFYLKSPDEMVDVLGGLNRAAVQGALEIADVCVAELNNKTQLPSVELPSGMTDFDYLAKLCRDGMRRIGKEGNKIYEDRLSDELAVVKRLRDTGRFFDRYFLVVWDYVNWAWQNNIRVGVGRGSGAGSLILYCLRITGIDPIPYDLLFERFLAEDRNEMPDIDIDFDAEYGDAVYQYVCTKYGAERCARIGTFSTFHVASAIKSAFRAFDPGNTFEKEQQEKQEAEQTKKVANRKGMQLSDKKSTQRDETAALANEITKLLPKDPNSGNPSNKCTLSKELWDRKKKEGKEDEVIYVYEAVPEFVDLKRRYPEIFALAEQIEGLSANRSVHAAGVLITEDPLVNVCPQQFSGRDKKLATAYDMGDVEKVGGVKFDFLRTKVLSVISRTIKMVEERYGIKIDIDNVPVTDKASLAIFESGDTTGIFQFESSGMRQMLTSMRGITFEDVIAANALFRPGPMQNIPSYCKRKTGQEKISYQAPALEPILKPTLGIIVYQEQVMRICRDLAGFTASEADKVRKAMGKKKQDLLDQMKEKFTKGCEARKSCSPVVAGSLWSQMEKFGSYAFNKSHSAGYSYTAYQCAYLKAHYPHEFIACQLTVEGGDSKYEVVSNYEKTGLREMKIKLLDPDVNRSKADYLVVDVGEKKAILKGFKGIPGLGGQSQTDIVAKQPYKDMFEFCMNAGAGTKSDVVATLIEMNAFNWLLPKLSKKLGRDATRSDLTLEYNDKMRRAQSEKREKGAIKEERQGMKGAFFVDDDDTEQKPKADIVL